VGEIKEEVKNREHQTKLRTIPSKIKELRL